MSTENKKHSDRMRMMAPARSESADHLIEDMEDRIANTEAFLGGVRTGEEDARRYIEEMLTALQNDLRRLERSRREAETKGR